MLITRTVKLPSEGKFYTGKLSSGEIELKPFTALEEDILSEQSSNKYKLLDKILKCTLPDDVDFNKLLKVDVDAIVLSQRIITYGPKYDVKITCPKCGEQYDASFDLKQISSVDKEYDDKFRFEIDDLIIDFEPETYGDCKSIKVKSDWLKSVIKSTNKHDDVGHFVDNIFLARQSLKFKSHFKRMTPELDFSKIGGVCSACDHESVHQIPLDCSFFGIGPQYKSHLHKEIFNLAYHSNGGFNQHIAYDLPVYLRRFYMKELQDAKKAEKDASESSDQNVEVNKGMVGPGGNLL